MRCRSRLWLLYWVRTQMRRHPALTRLDSVKSTSRYSPPKGTADLARSAVRGARRLTRSTCENEAQNPLLRHLLPPGPNPGHLRGVTPARAAASREQPPRAARPEFRAFSPTIGIAARRRGRQVSGQMSRHVTAREHGGARQQAGPDPARRSPAPQRSVRCSRPGSAAARRCGPYLPGFMCRPRKSMTPSIACSWTWSGRVAPSAADGKR